MALVRGMAQAYAARGLNPAQALEAAQITPAALHDSGGRITAAQMEAISGAAMRELDDEGLGCLGRALPWGSYGMLARASLSAPTLAVALKRWCRHHRLIAPDRPIALEWLPNPGQDPGATGSGTDNATGSGIARITLQSRQPWSSLHPDVAELCVVSVLRNIHGLASWWVDSRLPLLRTLLPYPAPPHAESYRVLFDGPCQFNDEAGAIEFDARYLALPLRRDEAAMNQLLQRALPLTVRSYRRDRLLVQRVRQALAEEPATLHTADALAARLNLSVRTLHRQLKEEGAALQALKDEVRRQRATELLLRTRRPVKQVALESGFLNEKSFIRAFRHWTGQSPAEWRQQQLP